MPQSVTYSSTRGEQVSLDFRSVVMQGLAKDRGLFVPDEIPKISREELSSYKNFTFSALAVAVISKFVAQDQVPREHLTDIIERSCASFRDEEVTPVVQVGGHAILELFHGPTFAFKDVALQMLGNFFEYFLTRGDDDGGRLTILGATSGDTGSAAIAGLRGKANVHCVILFPNGRVSEIQERQMTTILDDNIHCVAVSGTFDDCQDIVKACFDTPDFRDAVSLGAVNSINWCRVLAQTTYYVWSWLKVSEGTDHEVHFSVPTGNFGDVLAGYYARKMGVPIGKLIVATNENDILHRFFTKGEYHRKSIQKSISPSMDICVSSNFERYLFHLAGNDATKLKSWMQQFETTGKLTISGDLLRQAQSDFDSATANTKETLEIIQEYAKSHDYILCPHSAVGVSAIHQLDIVGSRTVCLATAHYGKFPTAVRTVVPDAPTPPALAALAKLPTRRTELPNDVMAIQQFVKGVVDDDKKLLRSISTTQKLLLLGALVAGVAAVVVVSLSSKRKR